MPRWKLTSLAVALIGLCGPALAGDVLRFWNTTSREFTGVYLAPAGTASWGANQTANDPDGSVSADERLRIIGVTPGRYDVKLTEKSGRSCTVRNVEVKAGGRYAFAIAERDLSNCTP